MFSPLLCVVLLALAAATSAVPAASAPALTPVLATSPEQVLAHPTRATFLLAVNLTFETCISTVATPSIKADTPYNASERLRVGDCDEGPLMWSFGTDPIYHRPAINVVFHSSQIEDASPPACSIPFNNSYNTPSHPSSSANLLPSCFVMDSREGYHMIYVWFSLLTWE